MEMEPRTFKVNWRLNQGKRNEMEMEPRTFKVKWRLNQNEVK